MKSGSFGSFCFSPHAREHFKGRITKEDITCSVQNTKRGSRERKGGRYRGRTCCFEGLITKHLPLYLRAGKNHSWAYASPPLHLDNKEEDKTDKDETALSTCGSDLNTTFKQQGFVNVGLQAGTGLIET